MRHVVRGVLFCTVISLVAQSDRGTITGTISDPAGAKVVAQHTETGASSETQTTSTGNYTLPALTAGVYDVSVTATGFSRVLQRAVRVQVAQTVRIDMTLQVGSTTDFTTVTEAAPLLRTENAEQSINVTGERINKLPLNFGGGGGSTGSIRSWLGFIQLAPGGSFKVMVEGQDLTSSNDTIWTSTVSSAAVEMIGEFSFQATNFAAEYGRTLGGVFNFTTKSGTNRFSGSAFEYLTNEALGSSRSFGGKPLSRKHDYGGTIGGPVRISKIYDGRNKTFFFFNFEKFQVETRAAGSFNTVPTAAYGGGDFSRALTGRVLNGVDPLGRQHLENAVYHPQTARPVNGVSVRDMFPGNRIPASRLDPVALKMQSLFPSPDNAENVLNWAQNTQNHKYQSIPGVKVDQSFNDAIRTSFYWSVQDTDQITAPDGLPFPITARRDQQIYGHTLRLNYDHTLSPTLPLHLGTGFVRFHNPDSSPAGVLQYEAIASVGFRGSVTNPSGFPRVTGISNAQGGMLNLGPTNANKYYDNKLTNVASMTWIRGSHTMKLGGEYRLMSWTDINAGRSPGSLAFSAEQTGLASAQGVNPGGGSIGFPYASFPLGAVSSASVKAVQDPQWRKSSLSLSIQDAWAESLSLGSSFPIRERMSFQIRAEFFNVFNRKFLPGPSSGNPLQTQARNSAGIPTSGFGFINATSADGQRNGQIVARFQF